MVCQFAAKTALERRIPAILSGTTPGQLRQKSADSSRKYGGTGDTYFGMIRPLMMLMEPRHRRLMQLSFFEKVRALRIRVISFHEHFTYDEATAIRTAEEHCSWQMPDDTDSCSTNCLVNSLSIAVHRARYGFSQYLLPTAYDVRIGVADRQESLEAIDAPLDEAVVRRMAEQLGVPPEAYMAAGLEREVRSTK
jgi:hypothetical protein